MRNFDCLTQRFVYTVPKLPWEFVLLMPHDYAVGRAHEFPRFLTQYDIWPNQAPAILLTFLGFVVAVCKLAGIFYPISHLALCNFQDTQSTYSSSRTVGSFTRILFRFLVGNARTDLLSPFIFLSFLSLRKFLPLSHKRGPRERANRWLLHKGQSGK